VQNIAMIRLLVQSWVEPPRGDALHASTLVQQLLSIIAERGGATAADLWNTLVRSGTFSQITSSEFTDLLRTLGAREILQQESSGLLLPGTLGEKFINSYEFYSAFSSDEEFRLLADGRNLGSLPIARPLTPGQRIIFAGRRWRVEKIETVERIIVVKSDPGGAPPTFDGNGGNVHDRVREEMRRVLSENSPVVYLDKTAAAMLEEARAWFQFAELGTKRILADGAGVLILTWRGDWLNDALALLLTAKGCEATNEGISIRVSSADLASVQQLLGEISEQAPPTAADLKLNPKNLLKEKWDWVLPVDLLLRSFVSSELDLGPITSTAAALVSA
jgi:ATP-dependent Lhr-like helicase